MPIDRLVSLSPFAPLHLSFHPHLLCHTLSKGEREMMTTGCAICVIIWRRPVNSVPKRSSWSPQKWKVLESWDVKKKNNKQTTCKTGLEPDETIQIEGGFGKVRVCKWQVNEGAISTLKCCFEYDNIYKAGGAFQLLSRTAFKIRLHVRPGLVKTMAILGVEKSTDGKGVGAKTR